MFSFLQRWREPLIVIALMLAPLASFLSSGHRGREPNIADRVVLATSAPVQSALTWLISGVTGGVSGYVALRGSHAEAQECRAQLSESHAQLNTLKEAEAENTRLKHVLSYAEGTPEPEIIARIIGVTLSSQLQAVRINRGESDGVRVGMPVVTPDGVVGQIVRAVGGSADVMLLTDPASRIGAVVQRNRVRASVVGAGDGRELSLDFVRREDDLVDGDVVITSGTDGVFPRGLRIGAVQSITRPNVGMFASGRVTPAVDIDRVEEILIIPVARVSSVAERKDSVR
jgi:rod shape-determining protein MreC